jgi:hypothetical protein
MNPIKLLMFAMSFWRLNSGKTAAGKRVFARAVAVVRLLGVVVSDGRVTKAEKDKVVNSLNDFHRAAISLLDAIEIPE